MRQGACWCMSRYSAHTEVVPPPIAATCDLSSVGGPCLPAAHRPPLCFKHRMARTHAAAAVRVCRILKKTFVRKLRPTGLWGAVVVPLQITISPFSLHPNKQQSDVWMASLMQQAPFALKSCTLKTGSEKTSNLLVSVWFSTGLYLLPYEIINCMNTWQVVTYLPECFVFATLKWD